MSEKQLEHLFNINLEYNADTPPVSMDGKVGEYIGSGNGEVNGPRLNGKVHWTLFEAQTATVCQSNLFGVITTDDEAEIKFDSMGIFLVPEPDKLNIWATSAGVSFKTDDERYGWLNKIVAVWDGELDMDLYRHRYQVYARNV